MKRLCKKYLVQTNTTYYYCAGVQYSGGIVYGDIKIFTTPAQIQSITSPVIENQSLNTVEEAETEVSPNNAQDTGQELEQAGLSAMTRASLS